MKEEGVRPHLHDPEGRESDESSPVGTCDIVHPSRVPRREILIDYLATNPIVYRNTPETLSSGSEEGKSVTVTPSTSPQVEVLSFIERVNSDTVGISIEVNQLSTGVGPLEEIAKIAIQVKTPPVTPPGSLDKLVKDSLKYGASREVLGEVCSDPQGRDTRENEELPDRIRRGSSQKKRHWFCCGSRNVDTSPTYIPADQYQNE